MADFLASLDPSHFRDPSKLAGELRMCGAQLEFDDHSPYGVDKTRLSSGHFCHRFRLCPLCAIRRVARNLRDNAPKVLDVFNVARCESPYAVLMLGTWTVRDGDDLTERYEHLVGSFRELTTRRRMYLAWLRSNGRRRAQPYTELAHATGGVWCVEFKRGKDSGLWHPHIHACLVCTQELDQHQLRREWQELTGDSFIVDVRPFHCMSHIMHSSTHDPTLHQAIADDLLEVLKYPLKFTDLTVQDNWHADCALLGKRTRASFGDLYGCKLDPEHLLDDTDLDELPYVVRAARWLGNEYELEGIHP